MWKWFVAGMLTLVVTLTALEFRLAIFSDYQGHLLSVARYLQHWAGKSDSPTTAPVTAQSYEDQLRQRLGLDWTVLAGRWRMDGDVITYLGPDSEGEQAFGLLLGDQRLWNGRLEAVMRLSSPETDAAQLVFSHNPVTQAFYATGIGEDHAYALQEFRDVWRLVQVFGQQTDISADTAYRVGVSLTGNDYSLIVNDVKVMNGTLPQALASDRVGLFAAGNGPVEFRSFRVIPRDPP